MIRLKIFRDFFQVKDQEALRQLYDKVECCRFPKGKIIIESGKISDHIYFNIDGVFRGFFTDYDGKEITDCIKYKYGDVISPTSELGVMSPISIETLSDAQVLRLYVGDVKNLIENYPEITNLYLKLVIASANEHWELKIALCQYSAMERYLWFLQKYPGVIDRINNTYIASFLNITPVTLSRIRGQLKKNNFEK